MSAPLSVLLVEDSATDAKLVVQELTRLGRPIDVERVDTAEAMRAALQRRAWEVVLSDWAMPNFSALGALQILKELKLDLPFIIVSGTIGEETAADLMRAGAHDYVLKDRLSRLRPAIERELRECAERAERRKAEEALRQSERRYRRLADSGVVGIVVGDESGRILEANDTFLSMVGYTRSDLEAGLLSWARMTPPKWVALNAEAGEQLRRQGFARPWEKEYLRKDGSSVPALVGVATLDGDRSLSVSIDLTARQQAEAGRVRAETALRKTEEQLLQAQKMEAVGRLAGGVAHDFNNLLSVILTYGELILDDLKPLDPLREEIAEIHKAALRAAGLTRQLLMFSRQEVLEPKVLDLHELLEGLASMLQRILGEDIELVLVPPKTVGRIQADRTHIEQVILNLAINARDAMPTGGKLTIETVALDLDEEYVKSHLAARAGPHVMLAVTDTGTGMDRATQEHIFEPFFTTKEKGKGTGLGLSTVFGIVQQSGGSVWVYSELGHGTSFKVYLPRVDAEVDVIRPATARATLRGSETVLLVEDEEQVRSIINNALGRQGYRVLAAGNAEQALNLWREHSDEIDLLLTDVVMPGMSGPELAKRLKAARPSLKVLCMSGYTDDSVVRHGALEPGISFLQKPITPGGLARKLREVLEDGPTMPELRQD